MIVGAGTRQSLGSGQGSVELAVAAWLRDTKQKESASPPAMMAI